MSDDRNPPNFSRLPMLWLAGAFAVGVLASADLDIGLWVGTSLVIVLGIVAFLNRENGAATSLVIMAFAVMGLCAAQAEKASVSPNRIRTLYDNGTIKSGDPVELEGVLLGRPEPSNDGLFLTIRADRLMYRGEDLDVAGNVRLFLPELGPELEFAESGSDLRYGSRLRIACRLARDDAFLNPGVISRKEILDRQKIDAAGAIKSGLLVEKLSDESVFLPLSWVYDQRARLIEAFRANLSPRAAGVMIASLLGDKYFLDKETADLFRDGGTFHILVISGLHITFIGGLLLLLIRQITRVRWVHFVATVTVLWAYTLAVGADVPVVRASLMFTAALLSYVLYRQVNLLNSLGISALILLAWRPSDLFDPGFQLTFVSVAAIVIAAYPLVDTLGRIGSWTPSSTTPFPPNVGPLLKSFCEAIYWNEDAWKIESKTHVWTARIFKTPFLKGKIAGALQRTVRYIFEGFVVSLIVQICMLPLSVVYFHRISLSSIILNLWVGVLIAVESFAAVAGALMSAVSATLATAFFTVAELADRLMLILPGVFAENGFASFRLPAYSGNAKVIYCIYALPLLVVAVSINKWRPFELKKGSAWTRPSTLVPAFAALAGLAAIIAFHPFSAPRPDGRLHFDFLDVGQGDSALVTLPDGSTMLVDGGGRTNYKSAAQADGEQFVPDTRGVGDAVVSEFLWFRGYSRVDLIVATHADADHIQGLTDVAKNFKIGAASFGRLPLADPEYAELSAVLRRHGIPIETLGRGDRFSIAGVTVDVLGPVAAADPAAVSDNDHSVVLRFTMGGRTFLLTGDIERTAEAELVSGGDISADVIKVPHHGSRTSSTQTFIDAVSPDVAIISVGRTSPFGHPHPDVVERWIANGARVMTTGDRGTISISTDGRDLELSTFQP